VNWVKANKKGCQKVLNQKDRNRKLDRRKKKEREETKQKQEEKKT